MSLSEDRCWSRFTSIAALTAFIAAGRAQASTIVVDSQGGGQFTDIPPAIAAAQPGDSLLVLAGTYSGFTLGKGLRIIGYGAVSTGAAQVSNVPSGSPAAVVHLTLPSLQVSSCQGTVLLQELDGLEFVGIADSPDVRVFDTSIQRPVGPPAPHALTVSASRLELAASRVRGSNAPDGLSHGNGGPACSFAGSRLHMARSSAYGGDGSECYGQNLYSGNGAIAINVAAGQLLLAGGGVSQVRAGDGPINAYYGNCTHDGNGACAILATSSPAIWHSGADIQSGLFIADGDTCTYIHLGPFCGAVSPVAVSPEDSTLEVAGSPFAGQSITFTLHAPTGSSAILYFGRQAIVVPDANPAVVEQLTPKARIAPLGTIPGSGEAQFTWPISAGLEPGTLVIAQAEVTLSGSSIQRTNSIPVLVR